ncbi:MAG TPA: Gfo/Idh/MocA family oxidoreductase [Gaiella sp.]|jgi:predicted dehydrogenase
MTEAPVRVGLAGLGTWGPNLARNFADLPNAELAWLCDLDPERLERVGARHPGTRTTDRFEDLLEDPTVDAVAIATPATTHAELARRALLAGKHAFVEKPLAMTAHEAELVADLAEERGLALVPGHLLLYHPAIRKLKEIVRSGELGQLLVVYGNRQNLGKIRRDENVLWSLGAHDLSVILDLVDEEPLEVAARGASFLTEGVEDVVFCYLRFPSGVVAHMHLSWLDPQKMRKLTVVGDRKMAVFDDMEPERKVTVHDKGPQEPPDGYSDWMTRSGDVVIPEVPAAEPLRLECEHFVRVVLGEADPAPARANGLAVVRVLEELQASLAREPV